MPLPPAIEQGLAQFTEAAKQAFGPALISVVLYGSAAEDALRPTSDINLILVIREFRQPAVQAFHPAMVTAQAALRSQVMFLLEDEIVSAAEAFTVKFADVARRRLVLFGSDPFTNAGVPRAAGIFRVRQVLLNLILRLRNAMTLRLRNEDELITLLAESAGPIRAAAATLLELEQHPDSSGKHALAAIAATNFAWAQLPAQLSAVREQRTLPEGAAEPALYSLLALAEHMRQRALALQP